MKSIIYFCDSYCRGAMISALIHLGAVLPGKLTIRQLMQLTWWKQINRLPSGQLLEVGYDAGGHKIFVLWVNSDKELVPRLASTFATFAGKDSQITFIDAMTNNNWRTNLARTLAKLLGNNYLSHYLFLSGICKLGLEQKLSVLQPLHSS